MLGKDKERHRKDRVTLMSQKLEWHTLEQRGVDIRLTMLFKPHKSLVDIKAVSSRSGDYREKVGLSSQVYAGQQTERRPLI